EELVEPVTPPCSQGRTACLERSAASFDRLPTRRRRTGLHPINCRRLVSPSTNRPGACSLKGGVASTFAQTPSRAAARVHTPSLPRRLLLRPSSRGMISEAAESP